jgi:disulfide bond formation protein DsbB
MDKLPLDRVRWPLVALLASAAVLAAAWSFEIFLYLAPCQMCWWQRYVYFAAAGIALLAIVLNWRGAGQQLMTAFSAALGLTFLVGLFISGWHALFEWGLAPGPEGCEAVGSVGLPEGASLSDILSKPQAIVSCKDAMWRLPNAPWGLSMAGWNALISAALAALSFYASTQPPVLADTANEPVQP